MKRYKSLITKEACKKKKEEEIEDGEDMQESFAFQIRSSKRKQIEDRRNRRNYRGTPKRVMESRPVMGSRDRFDRKSRLAEKEKVHRDSIMQLADQIGKYLEKHGKNGNINAVITDFAMGLYLGMANYYKNDNDESTIGIDVLDKIMTKVKGLMKEYPELDEPDEIPEFDLEDGEETEDGEEESEDEEEDDSEEESDEESEDEESEDEDEEVEIASDEDEDEDEE